MAPHRQAHGHAPIASRRMARRLLSGTGCATLSAYRRDAAPQVALHALTSAGHVLVAACPAPGHPLAGMEPGTQADIRLDITLEAADPGLRITAATAHLLGTLTWLDTDAVTLMAASDGAGCYCPITGEDPLEGLVGLADAPGGRIGVVLTDRVVIHDAHGVSGHALADILDPSAGEGETLLWSAFDTMSAQEDVDGIGVLGLDVLCDGVLSGAVPGVLCSHRSAEGLCASLHGRILCVDVAPGAVTLMRLSPTCVETFQVWLPTTMRRACEAAPHLEGLVGELVGRTLRG